MAVTEELGIAFVVLDLLARRRPVVGLTDPSPDIGYEAGNQAVSRDEGEASVEQVIHVAGKEGLCFHRRSQDRGVDALAIVAD